MKLPSYNASVRPLWRKNILAVAVLMSLSAIAPVVSSADRKPIGDLEIYKSPEPGTATIFMMLDVSGSMGKSSIYADYGAYCNNGKGKSYGEQQSEAITAVVRNNDGSASETITFIPNGCQVTGGASNNQGEDKGNKKELDRLSRLQQSLIELFADEIYEGKNTNGNKRVDDSKIGAIPDDYKIGIGIFGYTGGRQGKVVVPVGKLTAAQRGKMIKEIISLSPSSNTPTAQALAEAGAYMMGTNTSSFSNYDADYYYSGFDQSVDTSKNSNKTKYQSPLDANQCGGNGIYLLTDGEPNGSSNDVAKYVMNNSLKGSSLSVNSCSALSGNSNQAWGCMAEYASILSNPNNPRKLPIKTATVGYGKSFAGLTGKRSISVNEKTIEVTDCESGNNVDRNTKNLCKLGERRGDNEAKTYGDGGFYYVAASSSTDSETNKGTTIASSILDFAESLKPFNRTIPAGTITVPDNPYQVSEQMPYAYLPMLAPNIDSANSIWEGNVKKYDLNAGTLFGKNDNRLYKNVAGDLNSQTQDLWQNGDFTEEGVVANDKVKAGGVYAQLSTPASGLESLRVLYVEDFESATNKTPVLRKLSVAEDGTPQGFNALIDTNTYNELNKRRLLSFLGFGSVLTADGLASSDTSVSNLKLTKPTESIKVLGGVVHSKPAAISYSASLDENGRIGTTRDDYVLFGSMDGAVHLVDADDGKESAAIIPKYMLEQQPKALVQGSKVEKVGEPYFGVDAPWLVMTDYTYDLAGSRVTVDNSSGNGMFAYGGLRMGGEAFYGMDISSSTQPEMLFTITPSGLDYTASNDFQRMGQVWSKPTAAKVRLTKDADPIDVLLFGGGYDMQYESDSYVATAAAPAKGNAIYMINAQTGALIWSTSGETGGNKNVKTDSMIHSVTGGITVLDRDNDGLMDHLYAADLGGQVFRADFQNARPAEFGFTAVDNFSNRRVTRVLNTTTADMTPYRFYERPVVSFYRNEGVSGETISNAGRIFALVNVISGNRSAPLSKLRTNNTYANRVYGIIDTEVTSASLYNEGFTPTISNLTETNLLNLSDELGDTPTNTAKQNAKNKMARGANNGWYYPLTRFDGYKGVKYNKGVGDSVVINSLLYTTVYNPDKFYGAFDSCIAKIMGGSERQLYCLPYGVCSDESSVSGTGGYVPAGQGIQELTLGAYNKNNTDIKVLIGTTTIQDRIAVENRTKYGTDPSKNGSNLKDLDGVTKTGGDGSAVEYLFNERYTLQPKEWYEKK
ncbi:pilus assembly protein [Psychrobacter namhaensis]|uniref:PilC/PilY family type IV pilus protein n=1 Tax=Psychrobacter namhaensis TaxID=292734 RepID=UPI0018E04F04|nr:PilC/PilY family type IV pilus protein [Psychrobacter namhaensis]